MNSVGIILLIYCNLTVQCLDILCGVLNILCGPWRHENPICRWQRIFKWADRHYIAVGVAFGTNHR